MDLLSFCIAAAIGCMDEPAIYGPLRLLEVMEQVIEHSEASEKFLDLGAYIREGKALCMYDAKCFRDVLQEIAFRLIDLQ